MITAAVFQGANSKNGGNMLASTIVWFIYLAIWITAIVLAVNCNKTSGNKFLPILGAIFFPEIYLIQFGIRKYLVKEDGYCPGIGGSKFAGL